MEHRAQQATLRQMFSPLAPQDIRVDKLHHFAFEFVDLIDV
jgi:hypothetical protein